VTPFDANAALTTALAGGNRGRLGSKLPVRERLALLLDERSFVEDGLLARALEEGLPADGVVTGTGKIMGRSVAVIAHDPTVKAGSWGAATVEKQIRLLERADLDFLPVIYFVDSAGGRLTDQLEFYPGRRGAAGIFDRQVGLSGRVPQLCCLFGPSAAGGAYMPAFCDWVGMVDKNASMALASPRIAKIVNGEDTTNEEMGGAVMHTAISGSGDELCEDEPTAIDSLRRCFSYLPSDYRSRPEDVEALDPSSNLSEGVVPSDERESYDVRSVIDGIADGNTFFEIKERFAPEIVIGFARLEGRSIGIVANQPSVRSGAIFVDSADKAARFINWCDAFNIPLVYLVDTPGFMIGVDVERQGIIRHGAKMIGAMSSAQVPTYCVVLRRAYGAGYYAMASAGFRPRATLALPTAQIAVMGADAAVNAVHFNHLAEIEDEDKREAFLHSKRDEYSASLGLLRVASELHIDAVVPPQFLRAELNERMVAASKWTRESTRRHHGVWPV
jgi:acetyl-CoA carboxylase carboxyltransferase component